MNKEIVIIMGYNAAGKSTLVEDFVKRGYKRFNRDTIGGNLDGLAAQVDEAVKKSPFCIVLDNTYPTVKSRASIIKVGKDNKVPVKCIHLTTSFEDAQLNACLRMIRKTGKLLQPEDFKLVKNDPNLFPPVALFNYRKEYQKPTLTEGFESIHEEKFVRSWSPEYKNKALILDYDGTLRLSTGEQKFPIELKDIQMLDGRVDVLKDYQKRGYVLVGASNQSGIARGVPEKKIIECFEETNRRLGLKIDYLYCSHRIPPVSCYCRKPHPGMGAWFIEKYKLNPAECIMIGDMTSDKTFAERCGFQYQDANEFFK